MRRSLAICNVVVKGCNRTIPCLWTRILDVLTNQAELQRANSDHDAQKRRERGRKRGGGREDQVSSALVL